VSAALKLQALETAAAMRRVEESDEPALRELLRRVYGDTYSYRALYQPGGGAAPQRSPPAQVWGVVSTSGEMVSHTPVHFKDPRGDYVESGMSFRNPRARVRLPDAMVWNRLIARMAARFAFMHQNTSTWHVLAQRYAERHLRARPTGFIVDYVAGEKLSGIEHPDGPMQALTMSTVLRPDLLPPPSLPRAIPDGPWGAWAAAVLGSFGVTAFTTAAAPAEPLGLEPVEDNPAIGLSRRAVVPGGARLEPVARRTDLIHVPCDDRMAAFPRLVELGYVPVGVRPHATRPDELVLQHLPGTRRAEAAAALAGAALLPTGRSLLESWLETCARTS
jgi:hypothetical protein